MLPVGSPAVGKDFVDRDDEIKIIFDSLEKDNILLIAPRRYGKTSIMKEIKNIFSRKGIPVVFIDVYHVRCPKEFLIKIVTETFDITKNKNRLVEKFKNSFSKLKDLEEFEISQTGFKIKFGKSLEEEIKKNDWKNEGRKIFSNIRNLFDDTFYLIIDEFSEYVHNMSKRNVEEAEEFLKWFRSMRIEASDLKFIMGGSVSIDRIIRTITTSPTIDDLERVSIGGFPRKTALHVVEEVFKEEGLKYNKRIGEKIVGCIGNPSVPYFLSAFLDLIVEESMEKDLDERMIEELYGSKFMGVQGKHYFDYYVRRLNDYYTDNEEKAAKAILKILCQTGEIPNGIAFEIFKSVTNGSYEQFIDLIFDLRNDFYIDQREGKMIFYSKPLADWWRLYYV